MPIENTSLTMLSGVRRGDDNAWKRFYDTYKVLVFMRGKALGFSPADIDEYVARVRPLDRAGAYDIDESGDLIVASYDGEYENIMGLPVEPLRRFGII